MTNKPSISNKSLSDSDSDGNSNADVTADVDGNTVAVDAKATQKAHKKASGKASRQARQQTNKKSEMSESSFQIYRRLIKYVIPHWRIFAIAIVGLVIFAATQAGLAWIMRPLIDGSFVDRDPEVIKWIAPALIVLFFVRGLGSFSSSWGMAYVGRKVIAEMRSLIFDKMLRLPVSVVDNRPRGELISLVTYNVEQLATATTKAITTVVKDGLTIIFLLGLLFYISWKLSIFILFVGPVIGVLVTLVARRFRRVSSRIQGSVGSVAQSISDVVDGQRVIKTFGGETFEGDRFAATNEKNRQLVMKMAVTQAASTPVVQFIASIALGASVFFALKADPPMSPGQFVAFIGAMVSLLRPIKGLTQISATIQKGIAAGESVFAFLDMDEEKSKGTYRSDRAAGALRFEGVGFAYEANEPVLRDIDLNIEAGETIALVGRSGSGKSTLVSLLPRFYEPSNGQILLDGVALPEYDLTNLREHMALVSQQIVLFSGSVRSNVAYGHSSKGAADDERLKAALESAHAWEFVEKLPNQLDAQVGEAGVKFSGGQRQRLAIARAIYKDAPVLILDEATAALDTESERKIQAALDQLMQGRTTLVIAHRLSTIENADRIVVMDEGRIVEVGRHDELLELDGDYARLCRLQFGNDG